MFAKSTVLAIAFSVAIPANAWVETGPTRYTFEQLRMFHYQHLKDLREEVLAQQRADGGTLSPASLARFQSIDNLNREYQTTLRRYDPYSVNGFGAPIARTYPE